MSSSIVTCSAMQAHLREARLGRWRLSLRGIRPLGRRADRRDPGRARSRRGHWLRGLRGPRARRWGQEGGSRDRDPHRHVSGAAPGPKLGV